MVTGIFYIYFHESSLQDILPHSTSTDGEKNNTRSSLYSSEKLRRTANARFEKMVCANVCIDDTLNTLT